MAKKKSKVESSEEDSIELILEEPVYEHTVVYVPLIRATVRLRIGKTLEDWLTNYVKSHPMYKKDFEKFYGFKIEVKEK